MGFEVATLIFVEREVPADFAVTLDNLSAVFADAFQRRISREVWLR
jgi:hypothetical protein